MYNESVGVLRIGASCSFHRSLHVPALRVPAVPPFRASGRVDGQCPLTTHCFFWACLPVVPAEVLLLQQAVDVAQALGVDGQCPGQPWGARGQLGDDPGQAEAGMGERCKAWSACMGVWTDSAPASQLGDDPVQAEAGMAGGGKHGAVSVGEYMSSRVSDWLTD